ncbi:hypothetical protein GW937_00035 [Candidatus Kaiserbacteria bacterium]|nr:hypothetical protein [Candidatus Kaiserbacteria bacterium]
MTPEEKIQYVKDNIDAEASISPKGSFYLRLYSVGHPDNPDEWTILTRGEQKRIIRKLEQEKYIKNVTPDEKEEGYWMEKVQKRAPRKKVQPRRSNVLSHIKTTDQLIQERELFQKVLTIVGDIKPNRVYKTSTYEKDDDLIQLLIDLELIEYDWGEISKQTHRAVGNRIIEFSFQSDKLIALKNRISGKGGRVRKDALELIAKDIGEQYTLDEIVQVFTDVGVPETMFIHDTKWRAVFYILSYYTTSGEHKDLVQFLKIIERVLHPLSFDGDEDKAEEWQKKYNKYLKYDNFYINNNKAYIGPTKDEEDAGLDDWVSSDGEVVEPKSYVIFPDKVADLWIICSQLVILVSAFQNNTSLDREELEKLYLELIAQAEELISRGELGNLKETYVRPFTSLYTADLEARTKGVSSPLDLISTLLLQVIALQPNPTLLSSRMDEYKGLIERVTSATRTISGNGTAVDYEAVTFEQALFMLKVFMGHLYQILEASSTGYIMMADDRMNAKYILIVDSMEKILERKDFVELKEKFQTIWKPENLYSSMDEVDVWWSDAGGQSSLMDFIGSIETHWVKTGQQMFPLPSGLVEFLNESSDIVLEHKRNKAKTWKAYSRQFDSEASEDKPKEKVEKQEPQVQKVVHEHRHHFENSIQDKDLVLNVHDVHKEQKTQIPKFPYKIQSGTIWEKFYIQFRNPEAVTIRVSGHTHDTSYADMGFADGRTGKPNMQWGLLLLLAKNGGSLTTGDPKANDKYKKHKQLLSDTLKGYFSIDTDPFKPYEKDDGYEIKMKLAYSEEVDVVKNETLTSEVDDIFEDLTQR